MRRTASVAGALALGGLVAAAGAPARGHPSATVLAEQLSRRPVVESPAWRAYDEAPSVSVVRPVRVLAVTGPVTNPRGLVGGGGVTTLTDAPGAPAPSLVLDYGQEVAGLATFDVAATSGARFTATYSEALDNLGSDGAASIAVFKSGTVDRTDTFAPSGSGAVTAPVIQGGERYERVTLTTPGSVTLRSAGIRFTALRQTPALMRGHFLSSDHLLNRIWYAGAYTLNLNQMTPGTVVTPGQVDRAHLILDGAKRDRAVWSGDHLISDLTDFYVSDPAYAADSDALLLDHPFASAGNLQAVRGAMSQPGPLAGVCGPVQTDVTCFTWSASYSIALMPAVYDLYLYTGDLDFVRAHWPAVTRQMAWDARLVDRNGLIAVKQADSSSWNLENVNGELTYVNALYVEALEAAAKLARALGHRSQASAWSRAATRVRRTINARLWDRHTGVYDADTAQRGSVVQDANVTAILAGIPSVARARSIVTVMKRRLAGGFGPLTTSRPQPAGYTRLTSPYMSGFHVLAAFTAGQTDDALAIIRQEWGHMVNGDPGGVDWERIENDGRLAPGAIADSAAHAWSTGPTPALSQYVLGIRPLAPGFRTWIVAPQAGDLGWAQGTAPTPEGVIASRWRRGSGRRSFELTVVAPRQTSGEVDVPLLGRSRAIALDGRIVWTGVRPTAGVRARAIGAAIAFMGISGRHTFAWAGG